MIVNIYFYFVDCSSPQVSLLSRLTSTPRDNDTPLRLANLREKRYHIAAPFVIFLYYVSVPDPAFQVNPDPDLERIQGFDDQK